LRVFVSLSQRKGEVKLFVNSRPVQNKSLTEYIKRTVGRRIAVCLLEVPPFVVDANIHPKKLEVKIQREGNIRELFRELFKGHKTHIPSLKQERHPYKAEPELLGILGGYNTYSKLDGEPLLHRPASACGTHKLRKGTDFR
jgi:DNA mismatch repair protein MutL